MFYMLKLITHTHTNIDEKRSTSTNNRSLFLCILVAKDLILMGGSREGYEGETDGGL